jgi:ferric-dicitrate binding protein FerR (iron transport regulator)
MNYLDAQPEDFLTDDAFLAWYAQPNSPVGTSFANWLAQHPQKAADVQAATRLLAALAAPQPAVATNQRNRAWSRLEQSITDWEDQPVRVVPLYRRRFFAVAASVAALLLVAVSGLYFWLNRSVTYETAYAQTRQVTLPDGSRVTLNANSRLRLAADWDEGGTRDVWLDGEAYFQVRHTARHARFVVHTGMLNVAVLGTSFNVRNRADRVQVLLDEGRVRLEQPTSHQTMLLRPGEVAEATTTHLHPVRRASNPQVYTAWRENRLVFDQTPLRDVARLIEATYGPRVRLAPGLADRTFTYSLYGNDLELLLNTLAESLDLRVTRDGDELIFSEQQ